LAFVLCIISVFDLFRVGRITGTFPSLKASAFIADKNL
jgi:hypothetical protein